MDSSRVAVELTSDTTLHGTDAILCSPSFGMLETQDPSSESIPTVNQLPGQVLPSTPTSAAQTTQPAPSPPINAEEDIVLETPPGKLSGFKPINSSVSPSPPLDLPATWGSGKEGGVRYSSTQEDEEDLTLGIGDAAMIIMEDTT